MNDADQTIVRRLRLLGNPERWKAADLIESQAKQIEEHDAELKAARSIMGECPRCNEKWQIACLTEFVLSGPGDAAAAKPTVHVLDGADGATERMELIRKAAATKKERVMPDFLDTLRAFDGVSLKKKGKIPPVHCIIRRFEEAVEAATMGADTKRGDYQCIFCQDVLSALTGQEVSDG